MTFVVLSTATALFLAYYPGHTGKQLTWTNRWENQ